MTVLVVGASGATGRLLVEQLLRRGQNVRVIVRSIDRLPGHILDHENLTVIRAGVLDLSDQEMARHVEGCGAVASCLGHNLSFRGLFGPPRLLVAGATRRLCEAVRANNPETPTKFVLMNTAGNSNRDLGERVSAGENLILRLLRVLVPPHVDNEKAADYLRTEIGQSDRAIEWVVVRPDNLRDNAEVTDYDVHPSPTRSAIFDAGETSRMNVAHFMSDLIIDSRKWSSWKGQMPVIYNRVAQ